jgi:hypothetical protein
MILTAARRRGSSTGSRPTTVLYQSTCCIESRSAHKLLIGPEVALWPIECNKTVLYVTSSVAQTDKPFLIFIDANLPTDDLPTPDSRAINGIPFDKIPWMVEIETMLKDDWGIEGKGKTPETEVVITTFAPHFGEKDAVAPQSFFAIIASPKPQNPLVDPYVADDLFYCLLHYGSVPREI